MKKNKAHVIVQTAFLGDLILSVPLLKRIKKTNPEFDLIVICKKGLADFLIKEKIVDHAIEITKGDKKSYTQALEQLDSFDIQNVYCVHRSARSLFFTAQMKAHKKIGFSSFLGFWILDDQIDFEPSWPEVLRLFKILETTDYSVRRHLAEKEWSELNQTNARGLLAPIPHEFGFDLAKVQKKSATKKIALFPGSVWATKKWTTQGFTEVAQFFLEQGYQVDLMGGPDEKDLCQQIKKMAPSAHVLAGSLSIADSLKAVADYDVVISNDSASTHMAAYQKTPVVTVFGPTTVSLGFRPWSNQSIVVENHQLDCRPCGQHGHQQCPLGHHRCMVDIKSQQVIHAALQVLEKNQSV